MMLFSLGAKIKNLIEAFKTRVFAQQGEFEAETCLDATLTDLDNKGLLDNASLVVTPNAYEENLLFNVVPSDGRNILLQTEEFENAYWSKSNGTITSNTTIAPDGFQSADTFTRTTATGSLFRSLADLVGITYTVSVYLKGSTNGNIILGTPSGAVFTTIPITTTWQRYSFTRTGTGASEGLSIWLTSTTLQSVDVWGAQLEVGTVATDYQRNTTTRGGFQVTRATAATRVNEVGEVEDVPYNLLQRSQELENASWTKQNTTIGANVLVAPDGTFTADNVIANSGVTYTYTGALGVNVVANSFPTFLGTRTASVYLKFNGLNRIRFQYGGATTLSNNIYVEVDLQAGIITGTRLNDGGRDLASNPFIENVGDGWYRVGFNILAPVSATNNRIAVALGDSVKTVANGVDGVYVWGAQLVRGTQPKDYFPTTTRFNVPRIDYSNGSCPALLVEQQSRNEIRNNTMVGAVVGNPGTQPTNWGLSLVGLTTQIIDLGVENGVEYIDIRYSGTATGVNARIIFESGTQIVAATGQTWTLSSYVKVIAQPQPPTVTRFRIFENTSAGVLVASGTGNISPTTTLQRFSYTRTLSGGATVARVQPMLEFQVVSGQTYDFTIRVGLPQMEQQAVATSVIPTTTAAVTRNADVITRTGANDLIGQTEGSVYVEVDIKELGASRTIFQLSFDANNRFGIQDLNSITRVLVLSTEFSATNFNFTRLTIGINKLCLVYTNGLWKVFRNGVLSAQQANGIYTSPLTTINIGAGGVPLSPSGFSNSGINEFALYKTALTDAQAIQLTTL